MSTFGKAFIAGVMIFAPSIALVAVAEAQKPIRIGASASQTGAYAAASQNQLRGYQLCVKHVNEKGGVLGRQLELIVYDDWSDPATAVRLYEKLITQDQVDLVLGPFSGPITGAVADVTEKHKLAMVAPRSSRSHSQVVQLTIMPAAFVYCHRGVRLGSGEGDGEPEEASGQLP